MSRLARPAPARIPTPPAPAEPWASVFAKLPVDSFHPVSSPRALPNSGEDAAQARLTEFLEDAGADYHRRMSAPPLAGIAAPVFPII